MDEALISSLLAGDGFVINEVIESYIPLAKSVARQYSRRLRHSSHYDDLCSTLQVNLVQVIQKLCGKPDIESHKVESYLLVCLHGTAARYLHNMDLIRVPERVIQKQLAAGEEPCRDSVTSTTTDEGQRELPSGRYTAEQEVEYRDRLDFVARNDREREVLNLLIQGHSQSEIARHMETHAMEICRIVKRIRERWTQYG